MIRRALASLALALVALPAACSSSSSTASGTTGGGATTTTTTGAGGATGTGGGATTGSGGADGAGGATGEGGSGGSGGTCAPGNPNVAGDPVCGVVLAPPETDTITLTLTINDLTSQAPVKDLTVTACERGDDACAKPITTAKTDAAGKVSVTVPAGDHGFDGFATITGDGVVPELLFPAPAVTHDAEFTTGVATPNSLNLLSIMFGTTIDMNRGALAAVVADCKGSPANLTIDVSTADGCTVIGYAAGGLPSADAKATDATGVGFGLNVPPGKATLVSRNGDGDLLGRTDVLVKAGTLTTVALMPTP